MNPEKKTKKTAIIETALRLAAEQGWDKTTLADIARAGDIDLATLHDLFEDKADILTAFGRMIDRQVLENADIEEGASPRETLFDLIMDRFETLNGHRDGVTAILKSFKCDPKDAVTCAPSLCRSMAWMLEAAEINTNGLSGMLKISALSALYLKTAHTWRDDETPDLSKTMAELDKNLGTAEKWAGRFGF